MRKVLIILALTAASVAISSSEANAQLFGGRRGGISIGIGSGYNGYGYGNGLGYYGNNYYGNRYNNPYYGNNFYGRSYYNTPQYYGANTYWSDPVVQVPVQDYRPSYYYEPAAPAQQHANIMVHVPRADAKVWFDGNATNQQGMDRGYHSPPLAPNSNYTYTIRAQWMENGKTVDREKTVTVRAGESSNVTFEGNVNNNNINNNNPNNNNVNQPPRNPAPAPAKNPNPDIPQ